MTPSRLTPGVRAMIEEARVESENLCEGCGGRKTGLGEGATLPDTA